MCRPCDTLSTCPGCAPPLPTSLLVEAAMQEPVTVRVTGEGRLSTKQVRFSYLMSLLRTLGEKVKSKGTFMPGRMEPLAGTMDNSAGKLLFSQWKLPDRYKLGSHLREQDLNLIYGDFRFYSNNVMQHCSKTILCICV